MPYIDEGLREAWEPVLKEFREMSNISQGELNYIFTQIALHYIEDHGMSYTRGSEVITAFECAKLEFYRRKMVPYEDEKIKENGDVYPTPIDPRD